MTHKGKAPAGAATGGHIPRSPSRLADVAARAGVSIKTVSRVVNDEKGVLPDTRERVREAVRELGFVPDSRARSLKRGHTDTVGIVIDAISDPFFAAFVSVIEELALAEGLSVVFASTGFDGRRERDQIERMTGQRLRGLIVAPVAISSADLALLRRRFPVVCVDRARDGIDSVVVDDFGATVEAIQGLVGLGHRRIAFIGDDAPYPTVQARQAGYRAAMAQAGLPVEDSLVVAPSRARAAAAREACALLARPDAPTALFCATSPAAIAAIDGIRASELPFPAVISFGDFSLADVIDPGITCVDQDPRLIGKATFRRLLALVDDPAAEPAHIVVPTHLIRRGSGESAPRHETPRPAIGATR